MTKKATVGLLVAITCLILLGISPGHETRAPLLGDTYELVFHNVLGLRVGDSVVVGGVEAGKIVAIEFAPQDDWARLNKGNEDRPVVLVKVNLSGVKLPIDSGYKVISNLNTVRFINILVGSPLSPTVPKGGMLSNELPPEGEDRLVKTIKTFKRLSRQTADVQKLFANPSFRREMKDMASNMRFYSREFMISSANATETVDGMREKLDQQQARLMDQVLKMQHKVDAMGQRLHATVPVLEQRLEGYNKLVYGSEAQVAAMIKQTQGYVKVMDQYSQAFTDQYHRRVDPEKIKSQMRKWAQNLDDWAAYLHDGRELFLDPSAVKGYKASLKAMAERMQKLEDQLKEYEQRIDNFPIKPQPLDPPPVVPAPLPDGLPEASPE